jgi:CDGSH-type Zn-finger protein/uncharacterized Fe-S cluster protein YjdI
MSHEVQMSDTTRRYDGEQIEITFDRQRCIHAEACVHGLPAVFDAGRRPWIRADAASADDIATVVAQCPSGALRFVRRDGGPAEVPAAVATVQVVRDGPLYVRGDVQLRHAHGTAIAAGPRMALCRCGHSGNKPFCDNSHQAAGFADAATVAPEREPVAGQLTITVAADGPLLLHGPFALCGSDGRAQHRGSGALCRCGGSAAKPYCDGTHKHNGFRDQEATDGA